MTEQAQVEFSPELAALIETPEQAESVRRLISSGTLPEDEIIAVLQADKAHRESTVAKGDLV